MIIFVMEVLLEIIIIFGTTFAIAIIISITEDLAGKNGKAVEGLLVTLLSIITAIEIFFCTQFVNVIFMIAFISIALLLWAKKKIKEAVN